MSSVALLVVTIILAIAFAALLIASAVIRYRLKKEDGDTPMRQIKELKKRTADFGVPYIELTFGKLLGKGSQGEVFRAIWRGSTVAVKKIDARKVPADTIEEFCQEAEIMRRLRHPCLTLFMGVCLEQPYLCIVTEFVSRGSLFDLLHDEHAGITWKRALGIALDVAQGMAYLHGHKPPILHRDLKSLNILVADNWKAKVADFGMTRFQEEGTMTQCGSPLWMAPEMIKNEPYDEKSDVYSFGIVLWELYTRKIPYRKLGLNPSHLVVKVVKEALRPGRPSHCPPAYVQLMEKCWHPVAERRPTFQQVLKVLENFLTDPAIRNHKPGSAQQPIVVAGDKGDDTKRGEKKKEEFDAKQLPELIGDDAWKINDKESVVVKERIISPLTWRYVPDDAPRRKQEVYRASYRGKDVVLYRCRIHSDVWSQGEVKRLKEARSEVSVLNSTTSAAPVMSPSGVTPKLKDLTDDKRVWGVLKELPNLRHPNIVLFMGAYVDPDHVGVVMEHMSRGSLQAVIHDPKVSWDWDTMLQLLIDGAQGMLYLHLHKPPCIHDDLSSAKLMVNENWRVKVASYAFVNLEDKLIHRPAKPSPWSAPEMLNNATVMTPEANVYSFGMIMWEILTRKRPYEGVFDSTIARAVVSGRRPDIPSSLPPDFRALIASCWNPDASQRPNFTKILAVLQDVKVQGPTKITLTLGLNAHKYRKAKHIHAYRSKDPVTVLKDWGKNVGKAGSMVIVGGDDDVYTCEQETFVRTYESVEGSENEYRKIGFVVARCMEEPFAIKTTTGIEQGNMGDFLIQNENGDQWVVEEKIFKGLYEIDRTPLPTLPSATAGRDHGGNGGNGGSGAPVPSLSSTPPHQKMSSSSNAISTSSVAVSANSNYGNGNGNGNGHNGNNGNGGNGNNNGGSNGVGRAASSTMISPRSTTSGVSNSNVSPRMPHNGGNNGTSPSKTAPSSTAPTTAASSSSSSIGHEGNVRPPTSGGTSRGTMRTSATIADTIPPGVPLPSSPPHPRTGPPRSTPFAGVVGGSSSSAAGTSSPSTATSAGASASAAATAPSSSASSIGTSPNGGHGHKSTFAPGVAVGVAPSSSASGIAKSPNSNGNSHNSNNHALTGRASSSTATSPNGNSGHTNDNSNSNDRRR